MSNTEFKRAPFELEFESLEEVEEYLDGQAAAITAQRVRVGDFAIQIVPPNRKFGFEQPQMQIAHKSYKGNTNHDRN